MSYQDWLENSGVKGLDDLAVDDFPDMGCGIRTLRPLKTGEEVLVIPGNILWTVDAARAHPIPRSLDPPLSDDDTLVVFLLFTKFDELRNHGRRSHINTLPTEYHASVFFTDGELDACSGSSLYDVTQQLKQQIKSDYERVWSILSSALAGLFPPKESNKFTLEEVCIVFVS